MRVTKKTKLKESLGFINSSALSRNLTNINNKTMSEHLKDKVIECFREFSHEKCTEIRICGLPTIL